MGDRLGCSDALLLGTGFNLDMTLGMVRAGLVTGATERVFTGAHHRHGHHQQAEPVATHAKKLMGMRPQLPIERAEQRKVLGFHL
jgi:hypothetical protein